jgi:HlyD family secretion protein
MKHKILFGLAAVGFLVGILAAWLYGREPKAQPAVFQPASNPYAHGLYAQGIVESDQPAGENVNLYPDVTGAVTKIWVREGALVKAGDTLLSIDDTVQRASTAQLAAQAQAAHAQLDALRAQPRSEALAVSQAQVRQAQANLKTAQDQLDKQQRAYRLDPRAVSKDVLDNAVNARSVAQASLEVATRQFELTRAGAWVYDVRNQERQVEALEKAAAAAAALLAKYTIRAPVDGVVLSVNAAHGAYVSPQGVYETYAQGQVPVIVMGSAPQRLAVRCYVDEILIHRLPDAGKLKARMSVRGTALTLPLAFERLQPYVGPKIELSNARTERVDVRVLPVIFSVDVPHDVKLYPGQLVDVYIAAD